MPAREGRHEGVLDRQRGVGAGEQDRRQVGGVGVVDGAAAAQVGAARRTPIGGERRGWHARLPDVR